MDKKQTKIIGTLLFLIALSTIIYNIKGNNLYYNFTYLIEKYKNLQVSQSIKNNNNLIKKKKNNIYVHKNKYNYKSKKIDINSADINKLKELPGIGYKIAKRIIMYRQTNGSFKSLNDLMKVNGIGPKKIENLKKFVIIKQ